MSAPGAVPGCRETPALLERRREGRLRVEQARRLAAHLAICGTCRDEEATTEPLQLFAGLTGAPLPAGVENDILGGIRAAGPVVRRRRSVLARWLPPVASWEPVPILASLLLVGVLLVTWAVRGGTGLAPGGAGATPVELFLEAHAMTNGVVAVEDIRSPTAEVFTFSLDGEMGPTEVILIVDRSIDL